MPATAMFSKFKSSGATQCSLETNPIGQFFEIGKQVASAGPELVWRIHDAYRKSDGKECSVFLFEKRCAEKLHKPKRKETVTEILRSSVRQLERFRHPKILHVIHPIEECAETLAFATERVYASLANILAFQEGSINQGGITSTAGQQPTPRPTFPREYNFLDIEYKYGILQITEALSFLHYSGHVLHRNVCPASILVTKKGTWKLAGLEFTERVNDVDGVEPVACQPWTSRLSKMAQPNLDYTAPETQSHSVCSILSDMFSLGMVICAIFNHGKPLIQAGNSTSTYLKQLELLEDQVHNIMPRIPVPLQEATVRLLTKDTRQRPTAQLLTLIKYFSDPAVHALQFLDVINMKDPTQKSHFYRNTLKESLPFIPKKLWYQHVWPSLQQEMRTQEVLAAVLQPILYLIQESSLEEYESIILPSFRYVFSAPKTVQASVTLLENLHIILEKTPREDIRSEVLPMLYNAFESTTIQVQSAALVAVTNVSEYIDDTSIRRMILPKTKSIYEKNQADLKLVSNVLSCVERTLDRLDKSQIIDEVLPLLSDIRLSDSQITLRVVNIYRLMLSDKRYGLSVNLMATKVMPSLLPQTVNPSLNLEQFTILIEVLQDMLDHIDRNQRNKLKLDNLSLPSPDRHRPLRHQYSSDNMHVPPFNIPNLRIEQRKTSSAEDMARKNSTGGVLGSWWFGGSPSSPDSNFLRVVNSFPNRRLSDNTLMTPKIRVAPSCASSPGGTPGGGLPIRRHSSIGPQERRGSTVNLSPPTGGSMPNTSSSVPFLLSSSMQSIRSRRPSAVLGGSQGSGLLQQLGSGMYGNSPSSTFRYTNMSSPNEKRGPNDDYLRSLLKWPLMLFGNKKQMNIFKAILFLISVNQISFIIYVIFWKPKLPDFVAMLPSETFISNVQLFMITIIKVKRIFPEWYKHMTIILEYSKVCSKELKSRIEYESSFTKFLNSFGIFVVTGNYVLYTWRGGDSKHFFPIFVMEKLGKKGIVTEMLLSLFFSYAIFATAVVLNMSVYACLHIYFQLLILQENLEKLNCKYTQNENYQLHNNHYQKMIKRKLTSCWKHYMVLRRLKSLLSGVSYWPIYSGYMTCIISIGVACVYFLLDGRPSENPGMVFTVFMTLGFTAMGSEIGQIIKSEGQNMHNTLRRTQWYQWDRENRKFLLMFLVATQAPFQITSYGISQCRELYGVVFKGLYTVITFINSLRNSAAE